MVVLLGVHLDHSGQTSNEDAWSQLGLLQHALAQLAYLQYHDEGNEHVQVLQLCGVYVHYEHKIVLRLCGVYG